MAQLSGFGSQLMAFIFGIGLIVPIRSRLRYPKIAKFWRTALRGLFEAPFYITLSQLNVYLAVIQATRFALLGGDRVKQPGGLHDAICIILPQLWQFFGDPATWVA